MVTQHVTGGGFKPWFSFVTVTHLKHLKSSGDLPGNQTYNKQIFKTKTNKTPTVDATGKAH